MPITYRQIQSEESCCRPFLCIVSIHPSLIMLVVQDKPIQLSSSHLFSMSTIYQKRITERTGHPTNFSALANEFRRCARCHPILYSHRILTALCQSPQQSSPSRPIQCASKTWWPPAQARRSRMYWIRKAETQMALHASSLSIQSAGWHTSWTPWRLQVLRLPKTLGLERHSHVGRVKGWVAPTPSHLVLIRLSVTNQKWSRPNAPGKAYRSPTAAYINKSQPEVMQNSQVTNQEASYHQNRVYMKQLKRINSTCNKYLTKIH